MNEPKPKRPLFKDCHIYTHPFHVLQDVCKHKHPNKDKCRHDWRTGGLCKARYCPVWPLIKGPLKENHR